MSGARIVRVWVPLEVRIDDAGDDATAEAMAWDWVLADPVSGEPVRSLIEDAIDPTAFWHASDLECRYEVRPADD